MTPGQAADDDPILDPMGRYRGGGITEIVRPDGTIVYRARVRGKPDIPCGVWPTRELAEQAQARTIAALGLRIDDRLTLRDWGTAWMERREVDARARGRGPSAAKEWSTWRRHVLLASFADDPIETIARKTVVRWVYERLHEGRRVHTKRIKRGAEFQLEYETTDEPISRGTVVHALDLLRACLRAACDEGQCDANPAGDVRVPRVPSSRETWTWLRPKEIDALLDPTLAAELVRKKVPRGQKLPPHVPEGARLLWTITIYTGLRKGELAGLRWCDVRLDDRSPHLVVVRSYDGATKSGRGREVPLLPPAREAFERLRELAPGIAERAVWADAEGHTRQPWWDPGDWTRRGVRVLGRPVRFHDLRHTCASHLVQGTWGRALSLYETAQWLGHGDPKTTARYAHLAPEGLHARALEMAAAWTAPEDDGAEVVELDSKRGRR
jgi:integrase